MFGIFLYIFFLWFKFRVSMSLFSIPSCPTLIWLIFLFCHWVHQILSRKQSLIGNGIRRKSVEVLVMGLGGREGLLGHREHRGGGMQSPGSACIPGFPQLTIGAPPASLGIRSEHRSVWPWALILTVGECVQAGSHEMGSGAEICLWEMFLEGALRNSKS